MNNTNAQSIFVARPPSFGKSIFLNMLQLICRGNESRELFVGTEIYRSNYSWPKYSVLYFDFGDLNYQRRQFEDDLMRLLIEMQNKYHIRPRLSLHTTELSNLIQQIDLGRQREVVVLVDNYDAPITRCLPEDPDTAAENYRLVREFLECLQSLDVYLRLSFVTGVSRFPMNKKSPALGQFKDLTLQEEYAAVMGFTEDELETYFRDYLDTNGLKDLLQEKYFGYQFSNKTLRLCSILYSVARVLKWISSLQRHQRNTF